MEDQGYSAASQFWDREAATPTHVSWMAHPAVRHYINESISGERAHWPMDWFEHWLGRRRFDTALSIGCGTGPLERDLVRRNLVREVDAFDGSQFSIETARRLAQEEGVGKRINYYIGDFNDPRFPRDRYDIVLFHQSAHHVSKLEKLYSAILRVLSPRGLVYLDEYVGPSRFEWTEKLMAEHRRFYEKVPAEERLFKSLPLPIQIDDPSEAIRSSEIVPLLLYGFRIVERRGYGGNLLSVLFPAIRWNAKTEALVDEMIDDERALLSRGEDPYCAILIAEPRPIRFAARIRYFITPKLRRIRYEIRQRLNPKSNPRF